MLSSVHLQDFPKFHLIERNDSVIEIVDFIREVCGQALSIRKENNLRVRIPLQSLTICCKNLSGIDGLISIIKDEVNVKEVVLIDKNFDEVAKEEIVINFKECGKKHSNKIKEIIQSQKENNWKILSNNKLEIAGIILEKPDFDIIYKPKNDMEVKLCKTRNALVLIDKNITYDLQIEGFARDLIRIIQQTRKELNLIISDRIKIRILSNNQKIILETIEKWGNFIKEQTLAMELNIAENIFDNKFSYNIDDLNIDLSIEKC